MSAKEAERSIGSPGLAPVVRVVGPVMAHLDSTRTPPVTAGRQITSPDR